MNNRPNSQNRASITIVQNGQLQPSKHYHRTERAAPAKQASPSYRTGSSSKHHHRTERAEPSRASITIVQSLPCAIRHVYTYDNDQSNPENRNVEAVRCTQMAWRTDGRTAQLTLITTLTVFSLVFFWMRAKSASHAPLTITLTKQLPNQATKRDDRRTSRTCTPADRPDNVNSGPRPPY